MLHTLGPLVRRWFREKVLFEVIRGDSSVIALDYHTFGDEYHKMDRCRRGVGTVVEGGSGKVGGARLAFRP